MTAYTASLSDAIGLKDRLKIYQAYATEVLADTPGVYWRLDDTSGTTAVDSSGNSVAGTYTGSPTLSKTKLMNDDGTAVGFASASSQFVTGTASTVINGSNYSFEAWFKPTAGALSGFLPTIMGFENGNVNILRLNNGKLDFVTDHSGLAQLTSTTTLVAGTTYHVVCVYDGAKQYIYLNGVLDCSQVTTGATTQGVTPFNAGRSTSHGRYWDGDLDEVALYGHALLPSRIQTHYFAGTVVHDSLTEAVTEAVGITDTLTIQKSRHFLSDSLGVSGALTVAGTSRQFDTWRPIPKPDNSLILVCRTPEGYHDTYAGGLTDLSLWTMLLDGSNERLVVADPAHNGYGWTSMSHPEWSPDGNRIVLAVETATSYKLILMDSSGFGQ